MRYRIGLVVLTIAAGDIAHEDALATIAHPSTTTMTGVFALPGVAALTGGNTKVNATCIARYCGVASLKCLTSMHCIRGLLCANSCMSNWDSDPTVQKISVQKCSNICLSTWGDEALFDYQNCMTEHLCISFPPIPDDWTAPVPDPHLKVDDLEGEWWAVRGLHPLYDCYGCDHWNVRRLNATYWLADISYASPTKDGKMVTEQVHWPVAQTQPGEPIAGFCQGCFVKGMPHDETWYLAAADPEHKWIAMNYNGDTVSWKYHGALVLARAPLNETDLAILKKAFSSSVGVRFPEDFCTPRFGDRCSSTDVAPTLVV